MQFVTSCTTASFTAHAILLCSSTHSMYRAALLFSYAASRPCSLYPFSVTISLNQSQSMPLWSSSLLRATSCLFPQNSALVSLPFFQRSAEISATISSNTHTRNPLLSTRGQQQQPTEKIQTPLLVVATSCTRNATSNR
jgi:hypothetical protein